MLTAEDVSKMTAELTPEQLQQLVYLLQKDKLTELKELANSLWIAYDKKDERNLSKHILTAKEFGEFAWKLNQTPVELAKNIMLASVKIWYWKWACNWPKAIYQNYADVYNKTVAMSRKVAVTNNEWVF